MRGEDLLKQRRSGARQSQDENWSRALGANALAAREELCCAQVDLLSRIGFEDLGPVATFGSLERVAPLVIAPRLLKLAAVLERLAERKAQVIAIDQRRRRRRFVGAHARDFAVGKAVGLKIRKTPVRIAIRWAGGRGGAIGLDGLLASAQGLERRGDRQGHIGPPRGLGQQLTIERERLLVVAEADTRGRVHRPVLPVVGLECQQLLELLARAQ